MGMIEINREPSRRELKQFGGIFLPAFLAIVAGFVRYRGGPVAASGALLAGALLSLAVTLARPGALRWLFVLLQYVAFPVGWVVSHTILAVIYFLIVTPIGILVRLLKGDPMERRFDSKADSYWKDHVQRASVEDYFRQY